MAKIKRKKNVELARERVEEEKISAVLSRKSQPKAEVSSVSEEK